MFNSAEHEICPTDKPEITDYCKFFLAWYSCMSIIFSLLINIDGIFIIISRENVMLNSAEHDIFSANKYENVNSVEHEIKFCNL